MKKFLAKINFRQPKYIMPLVVAIPLTALLYLVTNMFGGESDQVETDHINMQLPEAQNDEAYDKLRSMEKRYERESGLWSAVDGLEKENTDREKLDDSYSDEEIQRIMADSEQKQMQMQQLQEMQDRMNESSNRLRRNEHSTGSYSDSYSGSNNTPSEYDEIQKRTQRRIDRMLSMYDDEPEMPEELPIQQQTTPKKEEAPSEVIKVDNLVHSKFNTVGSSEITDAPLIKAMIDRTTKSTEGTRLRFKLLDDVIVEDVKLRKGTYLYGTVSGFGSQRVKATINSILVGDRFLKVSLNVYDVDGMEGFYVPASSFREFLNDAAAGVAGQQIQINDNSGSSNGINPQMLALQALQNIYQAGSSAISNNIKKNKAKIKYNTIVYLINTGNNNN